MAEEKKVLTDKERYELNERIAQSYYSAYDKKAVKDGAVYDAWVYASHAEYWSPYFGNGTIDLETNPISVEDSATMEFVKFKDNPEPYGVRVVEGWALSDVPLA